MERIVIAVLLAAIAVSLYFGYAAAPALTLDKLSGKATPAPLVIATPIAADASASAAASVDSVSLKLVGVDENSLGQLADLRVDLLPGSGRTFVSFSDNNPVLQDETQESLKTAVALGRKFATRDSSAFDLRYSISAPSATVGGKSAGAAMSVATIALLTNTQLRKDVVVTGAVSDDGTVTAVGEILPKARAAKKAGFAKMLVPPGESIAYESKRECTQLPQGGESCTVKNVAVSVANETGLIVVEVRDVVQALREMSA